MIFETYKQAKGCCKKFEKVVKSRYYDIKIWNWVPCYTLVMK